MFETSVFISEFAIIVYSWCYFCFRKRSLGPDDYNVKQQDGSESKVLEDQEEKEAKYDKLKTCLRHIVEWRLQEQRYNNSLYAIHRSVLRVE